MTITSLPTPPGPADGVATFNARAFALLGALPNMVDEINAEIGATNADAAAAASSQSAAAASAATAVAAQAAAAGSAASAAASAGAALWVSGTTYAIGEARRSPSTLRVYIRRTAGAGTTDPASDTTNWALPPGGLQVVVRSGTTAAPSLNERSIFANAGAVAVTLPTSPMVGDAWSGHFDNGLTTNTLDVGTPGLKRGAVVRTGVIALNVPGDVHLVWCGDFWRFA